MSNFELRKDLDTLESAVSGIMMIQKERETVYANRSELNKKKIELEADIQIKEAESFMFMEYEGKNAVVDYEGSKVVLSNDKLRDAYRHAVTKNERLELAKINGELARIESELFKKRDEFEAYKVTVEALKSKTSAMETLINLDITTKSIKLKEQELDIQEAFVKSRVENE